MMHALNKYSRQTQDSRAEIVHCLHIIGYEYLTTTPSYNLFDF